MSASCSSLDIQSAKNLGFLYEHKLIPRGRMLGEVGKARVFGKKVLYGVYGLGQIGLSFIIQ